MCCDYERCIFLFFSRFFSLFLTQSYEQTFFGDVLVNRECKKNDEKMVIGGT